MKTTQLTQCSWGQTEITYSDAHIMLVWGLLSPNWVVYESIFHIILFAYANICTWIYTLCCVVIYCVAVMRCVVVKYCFAAMGWVAVICWVAVLCCVLVICSCDVFLWCVLVMCFCDVFLWCVLVKFSGRSRAVSANSSQLW